MKFVVSGTDTDIGKTVFCAGLAGMLGARYWKPVQAGEPGDSETVAELAGVETLPEAYRLKMPASPHQAAADEGIEIDTDALTPPDGAVVIEGAGGLMVPLTRDTLFLDVFARWKLPLILCARTKLGTINHTLLSIEAIRRRDIPLVGVAFIGDAHPESETIIAEKGAVKRLGRLPMLAQLTRETLARAFRENFSRRGFRVSPDFKSKVWHPFTQHALTPDMPLVTRGEGAWLETSKGKLLDAISSWWVITHGHRHPRIIAAIKQQADELDQVIFAGYTHQPAEDLARGLIEIAPTGLSHVFYSDSGSTSVEVALKMALGFWKHQNRPRTKILALEHAYHGDTVGTMSAGARGVFNAAYEPLLFDVTRLPFPQGRGCDILAALDEAARDAAALIVEPLILGAGGMLTYDAELLRKMHALCRRHGALFIADEVMTGFGRTGTLFACEQAGITPDILCLAKGLTGGSLPLAATLCTPEIFQAHYSTDRSRTFFHSSSFTANPIACAAARANLDIWRDEPVRARIAALAAAQEERLASFRADPRFAAVRRLGTITALDLKVPDPGYLAGLGPQLTAFFQTRGLLLRPLGNTIYVMPPYCTRPAELDLIYAAIAEAAEKFA